MAWEGLQGTETSSITGPKVGQKVGDRDMGVVKKCELTLISKFSHNCSFMWSVVGILRGQKAEAEFIQVSVNH